MPSAQAKSLAIVLRVIPYSDNSQVVKAFTRSEGRQTFIVSLSRKSRHGLHPLVFQPLNQLELNYSGHSKGGMRRIKEAHFAVKYLRLSSDPIKSSVAFFLADVLQHVLHENTEEPLIFDFLAQHLQRYDGWEAPAPHFHLALLARMCAYLGFSPDLDGFIADAYFDLEAGAYCNERPTHPNYLPPGECPPWQKLFLEAEVALQQANYSLPARKMLLPKLLLYYRLHVHDFGELKSLPVVRELLH